MSTKAIALKDEANFKPARRVNQALTASIEKRVLQWMASRAPRWLSLVRSRYWRTSSTRRLRARP